MHPECWQHKASANSLCSSAGLSSATPCTYCGAQYKDPRAHVKHCPVLFQFALAYTTHGQAPRFGGSDGGEPGLGCSAGDAPGLGRPLPAEGGGTAQERPRSRSRRAGAREMVQTGIQRFLGKGPKVERQVAVRLHQEHGQAGRADAPPVAHPDKDDAPPGGRSGELPGGHRLHAVRGHGDGTEHAPAASRCGTGLAEELRGGHGQILPPDRSLYGPHEQASGDRLVQTDDALRTRLMTVGWLSEGSNALVPTWHYYRWDPETRQQVKDERAPLAQDQVMHQVETLMRVGTSPTTLLRFKTLHKLGAETPQAEVVPFKISVSLRGPEAQSMFEALTALSYNGALLGLRLCPERMQKTALATELENAYLNTSFTDWTRRNPQWGRSSKKGSSDQ